MEQCEWCGARALIGLQCSICGAERGGVSKGRGEGDVVIQLVGLVRGEPTPFDGEYLQDYNPRWGGRMEAHLVTTPVKEEGMRFADTVAARREWMRWDGVVRPDGLPSRPLTAFNVQMSRVRSE